MNIRVRCATVLLRKGIKMSKLSKRGQVDLLFTLRRINREEIAVARQIHQKILRNVEALFGTQAIKRCRPSCSGVISVAKSESLARWPVAASEFVRLT